MKSAGVWPLAFALAAGVATVFAFAPFDFSWLPVITLASLVLLWQGASAARGAAALGFAFGIGLFGTGASWVYIALNTFGGMPAPLAAVGTAGFCAFLALYPAAVGWLAVKWTAAGSWPRALAAAALWPLVEWARSVIFTGFPWLSLGYAALPGGSSNPLAGYAPVGGVFLVSLAFSLAAAALALTIDAASVAARARAATTAGAILVIVAGGAALGRVEWTSTAGRPLAVSLVQGNVAQELKFDPEFRPKTFGLYTELVAASRGRLVVLPESAFPVFADEVPDAVLLEIISTVVPRNGDALVGMFTMEPPVEPGGTPRFYNSVVSVGTAVPQLYRKRHLVPFGETIPLEPVFGWFIRKILAIPLASQARGDADPPPLELAGQRVAVNICYEDAFGADLRRQAGVATLLVNVTNDAWYGRSLAALQHNQIAAMRALETGRPLLRATNTGITSSIGHDGRELARLPWFTRGILEVEITGRQGSTPYVEWGDAAAGAIALALFVAALAARRHAGNPTA
ncbi:MAG: apolipoprotein N-acyltransferase [Betaproteobacteria bacterium]